MSVDHFAVPVPADKFEPLIDWLKASFAHLGFKEYMRPVQPVVGLGSPDNAWLWITAIPVEDVDSKAVEAVVRKLHIAVKGNNVDEVKRFHEAGLKAGGTCNGPPGPRAMYGPNYYGAFVRDPACGVNWEVVYRDYKEGEN